MTDTSAVPSARGRWRYRAAAADGAPVRGEIDAESRARGGGRAATPGVVGGGPHADPSARRGGGVRPGARRPARAVPPWSRKLDGHAGPLGPHADAELAVVVRAWPRCWGPACRCTGRSRTRPRRPRRPRTRDSPQCGRGRRARRIAERRHRRPAHVPRRLRPAHRGRRGIGHARRQPGTAGRLPRAAGHPAHAFAKRPRLPVDPRRGVDSSASSSSCWWSCRGSPCWSATRAERSPPAPRADRAERLLTRGWWMILLAARCRGAAHWNRWRRDPAAGDGCMKRGSRGRSLAGWSARRRPAGYTGTLAIGLRAGVSLLGAMALARAVVRNRHCQAALARGRSPRPRRIHPRVGAGRPAAAARRAPARRGRDERRSGRHGGTGRRGVRRGVAAHPHPGRGADRTSDDRGVRRSRGVRRAGAAAGHLRT